MPRITTVAFYKALPFGQTWINMLPLPFRHLKTFPLQSRKVEICSNTRRSSQHFIPFTEGILIQYIKIISNLHWVYCYSLLDGRPTIAGLPRVPCYSYDVAGAWIPPSRSEGFHRVSPPLHPWSLPPTTGDANTRQHTNKCGTQYESVQCWTFNILLKNALTHAQSNKTNALLCFLIMILNSM